MSKYLFPALLGLTLLAGIIVGRGLRNAPQTFTRVQVDTVELYRDRPKPKQSLPERIVWTDVKPTVIATSTTRDMAPVLRYCAPSATQDTVSRGDSVSRPAVLPDFRGRYDGKWLRLWSTLSDGRGFEQDTKVSTPFEFLTTDSVIKTRQHRAPWRLLKTVGKCAAGAGLGAVAGLATKNDPLAMGAVGCGATIAF